MKDSTLPIVRSPKMFGETTCWTWKGKKEHYQEQAAIMIIESGTRVMPWSWIESKCETPLCMQPDHLLVRRPHHLEYPFDICTYCGARATTQDHLLPRSITGDALRNHVLTVPACRECNSLIGASYAPSITERRQIAKTGIRKKHFKKLRAFEYTSQEIREFGPGLRNYLAQAKVERELIKKRLEFPNDPTYDLRYLSLAGIEDPYAMGLILPDKPQEAAA